MNNTENKIIRVVLSIAAMLTIITAITILGLIGKGVYDSFKTKEESKQITLDNVDPKIAQDITSQLAYAGQANGSQQYYSPLIDATFTLNKGLFNVVENKTQLSIYPKDNYTVGFRNNITIVKTEASKTEYISSYKDNLRKHYADLEVEEEGTVEGLSYLKVSYTKKDYFNPTSKVLVTDMTIFRVIDKNIVIAETSYPQGFNITQYSSNLSNLLNTIQLAPKNIKAKEILQIKNADMELSYDRKKFEIVSNSATEALLSYKSQDNEINEKFRFLPQKISINTISTDSSSTTLQILKEYRDFDQSVYKDNNFTVTKENYKLLVGNREFTASDYNYQNQGKTQLVTIVVGKAPFSANYIIIKTSTQGSQSQGSKETIGLIDAITFKQLSTTQSNLSPKTGNESTTPTEHILGTSSLNIDKAAITAKPGIVHIYTKACVDANIKIKSKLTNSSGKEYSYCYGILGSGFFVSSDGYIITNGSVAIPNPLDLLTYNLTQTAQTSQFWQDIISDGLITLKAHGNDVSNLNYNEQITVGLKFAKSLIDEGSLTLTPTYQNYIEGQTPFNIDPTNYNVSNGLNVSFVNGQVDSETINSLATMSNQPVAVAHPDLAILKANGGNNYPALAFSDPQSITVGEKIQAIGFSSSPNNSNIFGVDTAPIPTITNGTIKTIQNNTSGNFKTLELDALIPYGNGGGPVLSTQGKVVGIVTNQNNSNEVTNLKTAISIEQISNFLKDNNVLVTTSSTTENISSGMDNFAKSYYKFAIANFNEAINLFPASSKILGPMVSIAEEKVNQGKDQTPMINTIAIENTLSNYGISLSGYYMLALLIALAGFVIFLTITITGVVINRRRMLSQKPPIVGNADLSVVQSHILNSSTYTIPANNAPAGNTSTPNISEMNSLERSFSQAIPAQSMPNIQNIPIQNPTTTPTVPESEQSITTTTPTISLPVGPVNPPIITTNPAPTTDPAGTVPVHLTSSYNPLPVQNSNIINETAQTSAQQPTTSPISTP